MSDFKVIWDPTYGATPLKFTTFRKAQVIAREYETVAPHIHVGGKELSKIHSERYIEAVLTGKPLHLAESQGFDWDPNMFMAASAHCAGVVSAVDRALTQGGNHVTLSSGLHHARRDSGSCFCTFNGIALAAESFPDKKILILDFDAHGGGGTYSLLTHPERQWDVSTSELDLPPAQSILVKDKAKYMDVISATLTVFVNQKWDCVLYNAGVDFVDCDRDIEILKEREDLVFSWAKAWDLPVAVTLAGGYGDMEEVVALHNITINKAKEYSRD